VRFFIALMLLQKWFLLIKVHLFLAKLHRNLIGSVCYAGKKLLLQKSSTFFGKSINGMLDF